MIANTCDIISIIVANFLCSSINILCVSLKVEGVTHTGPAKLVLYFTGATNILYTFGGHAVTV